jgi:hypothetical protein
MPKSLNKRPPGSYQIKAIAGYEGLQPFLNRFAQDHPEIDKNVFIAMRFRDGKQFTEIHQSLKTSLGKYGLRGLRADDRVYPLDGDLWSNVCVYMLACKYAVCVFEEIDEREFNPNVPLEYGFMRALNRQVLLLKDQRMPRVPSDMTGKIFRLFDSYSISETIQRQIGEWAERDLGLRPVSAQPEILELIQKLTSNTVLILGRLSQERKAILEAMCGELRKHGYSPVLCDFAKPANRDLTETISTIAHLSRFVIADLTDARGVLMELNLIVPSLPSVPVQPLMAGQSEYGMFEYLQRYPWVMPLLRYENERELLTNLRERVVAPAEAFIGRELAASDPDKLG